MRAASLGCELTGWNEVSGCPLSDMKVFGPLNYYGWSLYGSHAGFVKAKGPLAALLPRLIILNYPGV